LGKNGGWGDRILINQWGKKVSARSQQYRLDHQAKLYDMIADPGQRHDISKQHPKISQQLMAVVQKHNDEFMTDYYQDERPFVIAHPGSPLTQLPARDGVAHGGIKRSNKFPNCSFFRNWKSTDDKITWKAEVGESGTYKVVLYYAAKESGAKCELRFNESVLSFEIKVAHDVPELGAEHDRDARQESYVKNFKSVPIGQIDLKKGTGTMTLQATEIPGDEAMEFRLLTLERVK